MSFINLFNPSFLMFLGILVLVAVLLVVYIESKIREQNHKMSAMVGLISSLAGELNVIKLNVQNNKQGGKNSYPAFSPLIEVSDDEDNNSDDDEIEDINDEDINDDDINDDDDDDDDNNSDNSDDDDSDDDNNKNSNNNDVKILKLDNLFSGLNDLNETNISSLNEIDEVDEVDEINEINEINDLENVTIGDDLNELDDLDDLDEENIENVDNIQTTEKIIDPEDAFKNSFNLDLKTININLAEETKTIQEQKNTEEHKNIEETDYKKMSINKLRNIVLEKGLSTEPSKLKKPEILKMLGVE